MNERDEPVRHETTVINAGGDRGGGGAILGVIAALLVGIAAFLYFGGYLGRGDANRDINVNANLKLPDINITPPGAPPANPPAGNSAR